ncbi:MAG: hypothetical protein SFY80_12435 [Verrucomicrobiota bacterium]|nr:hypothetical protein [Verrucomicrobiota bacterium]
MSYKSLCDDLCVAGYLSHSAACCKDNVKLGDKRHGKKLLTEQLLESTATYELFSRKPIAAKLDDAEGKPATLQFHTPGPKGAQPISNDVLVYPSLGLIKNKSDNDCIGALADFEQYLVYK